jgi:DNA-binding CsgD family transcriptional regulator
VDSFVGKQLSSADSELDLILDGMSEGFYSVDPSWRVTRFNAVAARYFGLRACDVVGRVLWQLFPQATNTALGRQFLNALRNREVVEDQAISVVVERKAVAFRLFPLASGMGVSWRDMPLAPEDPFDGALDTVGFGLVGVSSTRYVVFANAAAHAIFAGNDGLRLGWGVHAGAAADEGRLHEAIGKAIAASRQRRRFSVRLAVSRPSGQRPYVVHVSAVARGSSPVTLTIADPERMPAIGKEELIDVFGLTLAEARLAILLAEGKSLSAAASLLAIGLETARTHLARARAKTQTASQVDLVRLLMRSFPG